MIAKIIDPARRRRLPEGFGWIDHRLVRENIIKNFSAEALALYLFLLSVADENGVSWYSDNSICKRLVGLDLTPIELRSFRSELISGRLIAYSKPHYQVLELPRPRAENNFRQTLKAAVEIEQSDLEDTFRRQPVGTEGMGVSLHPPGGIYRRDESVCDALPLPVIIDAIAGGAK